jgi:hypothetical protein
VRRAKRECPELANPNCTRCMGRGTYYYVNAYMASGVGVICECVEDKWKVQREWLEWICNGVLYAGILLVSLSFWGWTLVLWYRWIKS